MEPVVEGVTFYVKYLGSSVVVILMILETNLKDGIIIYNTEGTFPKKKAAVLLDFVQITPTCTTSF